LDALVADADIGVSLRSGLLAPLLMAGSQDATTQAMMVTLMLARLPGTRGLLARAARALGGTHEASVGLAIDQALAVLVDRLETRSGIETLVIGSNLAHAADEIRRIKTLLDGLLRNRPQDDWPGRLARMMHRLDAACRLRFAIALEVEFAAAVQLLGDDSEHVVMLRLEQVAGHLRNLEQEARNVGSRVSYDTLLREAADHIKAAALAGAFGLVDCVRLVEILAGPDEALALLDTADAIEA
jgi:hypothetical protein